ncbi:MAG TPA: YihY/virulence factor BrkB family protein [Caulobacteraceae bacterium]|jgi:membrane protein
MGLSVFAKPPPLAHRRHPGRFAWRLTPWLALGVMLAIWPRRAEDGDDLDAPSSARFEHGRGRHANAPDEIPPRGWRDILWRAWKEFNEDQILNVSAGVAFFGVLALFPGMAAFVSLYGLFADVGEAQAHLAALAGVIPADTLTFIGQEMTRIAASKSASLSLTFAFSFLLSIWSANAGVKGLFSGLNVAYEEREKRSFLKLNLTSLAFTVLLLVFLAVAMAAVVAAPVAMQALYLDPQSRILAALRWPGLLLVVMAGLSILYRFGPSREQPRWRWVTVGGSVAALGWLAVSLLFSWYVASFAHYDVTYGSIGAVVGFMTWLWLTATVILLGAELNAEVEHQTAQDTTTGAPLPMGLRGAEMADTLGVAAPDQKPAGMLGWLRRREPPRGRRGARAGRPAGPGPAGSR